MNGFAAILIELNLAAAAAILFVLLVRRPAARLFGPHAAYSLWAMVPVAMLATFLPERTVETLVGEFLIGGVPASHTVNQIAAASWLAPALLAVWLIGAIALTVLLVRRQRAFLKDAEIGLAGPAIVGFRHPRIVTPDDFARRYSHDERKLILTHEQVHIERNDARINALVAAVRCVFWFNPLVHIGANAMRIDQELSCDAEVIDRRPRIRRAYAETLLKTQLASRPLPVGCYWPAQSQHPLAERISLIAAKPVSGLRRAAATVIVVSLTAGAGVAAWAAQPERTIFRETADVLMLFEPIPLDEQKQQVTGETQPRPLGLPQSFTMPPMPQGMAKAEVGTELCVTSQGAVESAALTTTSGDAALDAAGLAAVRDMQFAPATRNAAAISVCNYRFTIVFDDTPP
jgi:TonB family protein